MRDYGRVFTRFWTSGDLSKLSDQGKLLALYLLTGPHSTLLGCYRLPKAYITADLVWSSETVSKRFQELSGAGFCTYEETTQYMLVHKFLKWNPIQNRNQGVAAAHLANQVPDDSGLRAHLGNVLREHGKHLPEGFLNSFETLSKQFRIQEQEQEQEQERSIVETQEPVSTGADFQLRPPDPDDRFELAVLTVWDYYIPTIGRNPKLYSFTDKRKQMGKRRLSELHQRADEPKLERAIAAMKLCVDRMKASDWHMGRDPKTQGKRYYDWENLFRTPEQLEYWLDDERHGA